MPVPNRLLPRRVPRHFGNGEIDFGETLAFSRDHVNPTSRLDERPQTINCPLKASGEPSQLDKAVSPTVDLVKGSLWIAGSYSQNAFNEAFQERFAPFSHVMNEFKKAQIEREFFLRDPSVRSQPRT